MLRLNLYRWICFLIIFLLIQQFSFSQNLELPRVSPAAEITQTIGLSKIIIKYSRPGVRGRDIWDGLVPYNEGIPFPWRAGANENTTIYFSNDVKVKDQELLAGTYGFHIIPSNETWILIFNKQYKAWGSFFYDSAEDALRIEVIPERIHFNEWLEYRFENLTSNSADICMHWENLNVRFKVEFNEVEVVLNSIREQLSSLPGFGWQGPMQAAQYCLDNDISYDEAIRWIDQSIQRNSNFSNNIVKVDLLLKMGEDEKAKQLEKIAFENASEGELNIYGYQLINKGRIEDAVSVFELNLNRHPDSWNVYDSYAEALNQSGNIEGAIKNYEIALSKAPEDQKERIQQILTTLNNP
ncbi:MAG: DUF2911 domain-containing protein [Bacteroidota bacterium]